MNEIDPNKFHTVTPKKKKIFIGIGLLLILTVLPIFGFFYYNFALNRPAQGQKEGEFTIGRGASVTEIAKELYEEEFVNSEFLFKAFIISQKLHGNMQAGVYRIPAGASIKDLAEIFQHGTLDRRITFLEGWRIEEYALEAAEKFEIKYEDFVKIAALKEGYLFPDTYFFQSEATEEEIISQLRNTFDEKTKDVLTAENLEKIGLTKDEVVILASIVEREVAAAEDRPVVAGILIKRWLSGQLVGADATTQYAVASLEECGLNNPGCPDGEQAEFVDWWPKALTVTDLDSDSPYNTRKVAGLPPAPISNSSLSAIESVVNSQSSTYNYYLNDKDGATHYAVTLEEHNANVYKYLSQ